VNGHTQLQLSFEPGLTARFRELEDCLQHVVMIQRGGVDAVAPHLNMAPSELSRRLNAHHAIKEGDPNNRPLRVQDFMGILEATNNDMPIYWLIEKRLRDPDAQRAAAAQQIALLAPMLLSLAEQAGIEIKGKARR
jgi:hypothetical protein